MLISIVIPTYNEEKDIRRTLDTVLALTYPEKEIIVVDDSNDRTPEIVAEYEARGVRLIRRGNRRNGCCGARNLGMMEAKGEVVILLNGDVVLAPDFIEKITPYYEEGADFVVVESKVLNQGSLYSRYVGAMSDAQYAGQDWLLWSEGFSCRRSAAIAVGLIPGDFPIPFCRDWLFGMYLQEAGYRKRLAREVVAGHIAPEMLGEYWQVRWMRGRISALFKFFIDGVPLPLLPVRIALKNIRALVGILLVAPLLIQSMRAASYSPLGINDVPGFALAGVLERLAFSIGEWSGFVSVCRKVISREIHVSQALGHLSKWRCWLGERQKLRAFRDKRING